MLKKFATFEVLSARMGEGGSQGFGRTAARHEFNYEPRPGFLYVRSRAISSRCNDNYDHFPAEEIEKSYRTFIGKPVFVNHVNDDHRRARGVCIDAALHRHRLPDGQPDTWCEVLMEVDAVRFPKLAQAILSGRIDRTSMGTDVEHSVCSICANKATTPGEYCNHIPARKGSKIIRRNAKTGKSENALCFESCYGLSFFENSLLVEEPADPTAFFTGIDRRGLQTSAKKTKDYETVTKPDDLREKMQGTTLAKDKDGYFVHTHRARSDSYDTPQAIPQSKIDFIESTGAKDPRLALHDALTKAAGIKNLFTRYPKTVHEDTSPVCPDCMHSMSRHTNTGGQISCGHCPCSQDIPKYSSLQRTAADASLYPAHPLYRPGDRVQRTIPGGTMKGETVAGTVHAAEPTDDPDGHHRIVVHEDERQDRWGSEGSMGESQWHPHSDAPAEQMGHYHRQQAKNSAGEPYVPEGERNIDVHDREIVHHLTDDPHFRLDTSKRPENNTTMGGDLSPRLFVGNPTSWANHPDYGYKRPYVAEISAPKDTIRRGGYNGEGQIMGRHFEHAHVNRVMPYDAHHREQYGEPGPTESHAGHAFDTKEPTEGKSYPQGYKWGGDTRDWSEGQHREHLKSHRDYLHEGQRWGWNEFNDKDEHVGTDETDDEGMPVFRDRRGNVMSRGAMRLTAMRGYTALDRAMSRVASMNKQASDKLPGGYLDKQGEYAEHWAKPEGDAPYNPVMAHHGIEDKQEGHGPWHLTRHPDTRAHQLVDNQNRLVNSYHHVGDDEHQHEAGKQAANDWATANQSHGHMPKWHDRDGGEFPEHGVGSDHYGRGLTLGGHDVSPETLRSHQPQPPFETHEDPLVTERKNRPAAPVGQPKGSSPSDEWHGPYQVHQHPETGKFHVLDNQGRAAATRGFDEQHQAEGQRDHIDRRTQSKERAKGIADSLLNGFAETVSGGEHKTWDEMSQAQRPEKHMRSMNDLMHTYEGSDGKFGYDKDEDDEGEPYHEVESKSGSGWTARDYGGANVHIHHKATGDDAHDLYQISGGMEGDLFTPGTKPPGWNHEHLHDTLKKFEDSVGQDYANNEPRIKRWQQRNRRQSKLAYGETKAPPEVNTLRDDSCPVCGDEDYDGGRCEVCQFDPPPKMFQDPDLSKAREINRLQDQQEDGQAPTDLNGQELPPVQEGAEDGQPVVGDDAEAEEVSPDDVADDGTVPVEVQGLDDIDNERQNYEQQQNLLDQSGQPIVPGQLGLNGEVSSGVPHPVDPDAAQGRVNQGGEPFTPGPNAPAPQQPLSPEDLDEEGNPVEEEEPEQQGQQGQGGSLEGEVPGYPGDDVPDLICPVCGFTAGGASPLSTPGSQDAPSSQPDGLQAGQICPNCQQATMMSPAVGA